MRSVCIAKGPPAGGLLDFVFANLSYFRLVLAFGKREQALGVTGAKQEHPFHQNFTLVRQGLPCTAHRPTALCLYEHLPHL
jgi:hypothetical protein